MNKVIDIVRSQNFHAPLHIILLSCLHVILFFSNPTQLFWDWGFKKGDKIELAFISLLVHVNVNHLVNNLALQLPLGILFEMMHSHIASILIFWISGLFGAMVEISILGDHITYGGASPGDFAIVSAYIGHIIINWNEASFKWVILFMIVFYVILTVIYAVIDSSSNVAHWAHLGGFVHGIFMGIVTVKNYKVYKWEYYFRIMCAFICGISFMLFLIL